MKEKYEVNVLSDYKDYVCTDTVLVTDSLSEAKKTTADLVRKLADKKMNSYLAAVYVNIYKVRDGKTSDGPYLYNSYRYSEIVEKNMIANIENVKENSTKENHKDTFEMEH